LRLLGVRSLLRYYSMPLSARPGFIFHPKLPFLFCGGFRFSAASPALTASLIK
jgi:hypothetical protein